MRSAILLALGGLCLASCDSPYGKLPDNSSQAVAVSTGSHLPRSADQQPSNVQVLNGDSLGNAQAQGAGKVPGAGP